MNNETTTSADLTEAVKAMNQRIIATSMIRPGTTMFLNLDDFKDIKFTPELKWSDGVRERDVMHVRMKYEPKIPHHVIRTMMADDEPRKPRLTVLQAVSIIAAAVALFVAIWSLDK